MAQDKIKKDIKEKDTAPASVSSSPSSSALAMLGDHVQIDLSKELPQYSTPHCSAYAAQYVSGGTQSCFALICNPRYTPRHTTATYYAGSGDYELVRSYEGNRVGDCPAGGAGNAEEPGQ